MSFPDAAVAEYPYTKQKEEDALECCKVIDGDVVLGVEAVADLNVPAVGKRLINRKNAFEKDYRGHLHASFFRIWR